MKHLQKFDFLTLSILLLVGLVVSLLIYMPAGKNGTYIEVRINGKVTEHYSLSENRTETITTTNGSNTFYIKDGKAFMKHADCHDQVCVGMHGISHQGQTIVCLPHKLVLAVVDDSPKSPAYDAVTGGAS